MRRAMMLVLALILAGCDAVFSPEPVGSEVVKLDPAEWQGTWTSTEAVAMTTVTDAEAGRLQLAWMERGESGAFMETREAVVRKSGDLLFLSLIDPVEEAEPATAGAGEQVVPAAAASAKDEPAADPVPAAPRYLWARIDFSPKRVIGWLPRQDSFQAAVREGRLPGTIAENENVHLGSLTPEHLALISSPESQLLYWDEPLVFVRAGD